MNDTPQAPADNFDDAIREYAQAWTHGDSDSVRRAYVRLRSLAGGPAPAERTEELERICAESYQVVGILADEAGRFNDHAVTKALDNLSQQELVHDDVLPFPSTPPGPLTDEQIQAIWLDNSSSDWLAKARAVERTVLAAHATPQAPAADERAEPVRIPLPPTPSAPHRQVFLRRDEIGRWALYVDDGVPLRVLGRFEAEFVDAAIRATRGMGQAAEPVARLLHWAGPAHYHVPHDGIAARTFVEFPRGEGEKPGGMWKEGAPLYAAPRAEAAAPAEPPLKTDQGDPAHSPLGPLDAASQWCSLSFAEQMARKHGTTVGEDGPDEQFEVSFHREQLARLIAEVRETDAASQCGSLPQAWRDVVAERRRQIEVEGWTPEHDDEHAAGGMAMAAAAYAVLSTGHAKESFFVVSLWKWTGWSLKWLKPKDPRHNLIRAAALILAEIERLDRASPLPADQGGER